MNNKYFFLSLLCSSFMWSLYGQPDDWLGYLGGGVIYPKDHGSWCTYSYGFNIRFYFDILPMQPIIFLKCENNEETVIIGGLRKRLYKGFITIGGGTSFNKELINGRFHIDYEIEWDIPILKWRMAPAYEYVDYSGVNISNKHVVIMQFLINK